MHQVHFVQDSALLQCNGIPLSKFKQSPWASARADDSLVKQALHTDLQSKVAVRWVEAAFLLFATSEDSLGFHLPVLQNDLSRIHTFDVLVTNLYCRFSTTIFNTGTQYDSFSQKDEVKIVCILKRTHNKTMDLFRE